MLVEEAGVAGMYPAVLGLGARGRLRVFIVGVEYAGAAVHDFAAVVDLDLDVDRGGADGIGVNLAVGLHADENHAFGLAVELLDVDAERAVEVE